MPSESEINIDFIELRNIANDAAKQASEYILQENGNKALQNIPDLDEWLSQRILKKFNFITWKKAILNLHNPKNVNKKGDFLKRLITFEV